MGEAPDHDVLIVGAGISGISMGAHLRMMCPGRSFSIVERRSRIGGTWDLFRYPGIRSDSDMHTLGFRFAPWPHEKAIAGGEDIRAYLEQVAQEYRLIGRMRFDTSVVSADWRSAEALWHVVLEDGDGRRDETCRWLYLASGYYDYDEPHKADLPGLRDFGGQVVHPQFWPRDLDHSGKRVVVIGSGATAVTLVPAMAEGAEHVMMLQRTPSWMVSQASVDPLAATLRRLLPERWAQRLMRWLNIRLHRWFYNRARKRPKQIASYLENNLRKQLGRHYNTRDFTPPYDPWDQRLCLVPDGDLMRAITRGKAGIVTGRIARFDRDGVLLQSGEHLDADIVVTATGLKLALGGTIAVSLDGALVNWAERWFYRSCMFSNLPNLAVVFGYLNASWTLRADNTADYVCRVLNHMEETGSRAATPVMPPRQEPEEDDIVIFSSGYLQRARHLMPKSAARLPWRLNQDYVEDCRDLRARPVSDAVLRFDGPSSEAVASGREIA